MLSGERQEAWGHTHPLNAQRIEYMRRHVERSRYSDAPGSARHGRTAAAIKVKIRAFLDPPSDDACRVSGKRQSALARYARAIANYRIPRARTGIAG